MKVPEKQDLQRAAPLEPGSNRKGSLGGGWLFALPELKVPRAIVRGDLHPHELSQLAVAVSELVIVGSDPGAGGRTLVGVNGQTVPVTVAEDHRAGSADLVVVAVEAAIEGSALRWGLDHVSPEGVVVLRPSRRRRRGRQGRHPTPPAMSLWVAPDAIHPAVIAPAIDQVAVACARERLSASKPPKIPWLHWLRSLRRGAPGTEVVLAGPGVEAQGVGPPLHLQRIAGASGVDLAGKRWLADVPVTYPSRKVVYFVFDDDPKTPELIIKTTREPRFNERLDREASALDTLHRTTRLPSTFAPRVVFRGRTVDSLVVGETPLMGRSLRDASQPNAECSAFARGVEWIIDLALAVPQPTSPAAVVDVLDGVVESFGDIVRPRSAVMSAVRDSLATLGASRDPFPLVFEHGDPGPWNGVVAADGSVGFHDWENATPAGMPLWDLFHFARSHAVWSARARGRRDRLAAVTSALVDRSPLATKVETAVKRLIVGLRLDPGLVWPLFVLCWVERAIREASTRPGGAAGGHFASLVEACVSRGGLGWWSEA